MILTLSCDIQNRLREEADGLSAAMKKFMFIFAVVAATFVFSDAYIPRMIRGRPKGGLLGSPGRKIFFFLLVFCAG